MQRFNHILEGQFPSTLVSSSPQTASLPLSFTGFVVTDVSFQAFPPDMTIVSGRIKANPSACLLAKAARNFLLETPIRLLSDDWPELCQMLMPKSITGKGMKNSMIGLT